jgi:hypothetical protein
MLQKNDTPHYTPQNSPFSAYPTHKLLTDLWSVQEKITDATIFTQG